MRENGKYAVIVAHPGDETLWAGGIILMHPQADWTIISLCGKNDLDRGTKFSKALLQLNAKGDIGDLNDDPDQPPLNKKLVQNTILQLLPSDRFDLVFTHGPWGEYTRDTRHEETSKAVSALWESEQLLTHHVWMFAYEDSGRKSLPYAVMTADFKTRLIDDIWKKKYDIITNIYGFSPDSFEAKTTPKEEAFWCFEHDKL